MFEDIKKQLKEIEAALNDQNIINDHKKYAEINRRHSELSSVAGLIKELEKTESDIRGNHEIIADEKDGSLKKMAEAEIEELEKKREELRKKINAELNPDNPNDKKNVITEIRAGTGGDESALFAADLFRMYSRYCEKKAWKLNILNSSRIGIGGFKEIIFEIKGKGVYADMKYEAGTHRVQRIPETEKQGRIHTSTATVVVLPEAEELDLEIKNEDLRIDTYAASGPGGQKVNTTNSAVRITHVPTNLVVQCQDQKDQHQNKEKAMQILRARLMKKIEDERREKESADRKLQVGSGDRSEKIRTYNFPQGRVTDHRIKKSWHSIDRIMDGEIEEIINELKNAEEDNQQVYGQ